MTKKRVLITGGAGFLGSYLTDRLLHEGCEVICVDNLLTGSLTNISKHFSNRNFTFHELNVQQHFDFQVHEIYNFACAASPDKYQVDPIDTAKTCFMGALNSLELATKYRAKILHASTSEVYGDPKIHPQTEEYWGNVNPIGPRACYDEGKRIAETLFFDYSRSKQLDVKVARIFNTYGPRMQKDDGRVVSNFMIQAIKNEPITIYGDGRQTRSFCYVHDMIDGLMSLMDCGMPLNMPVNLGNPSEYTVLDLAEKIIQVTGSASELLFKALPEDDPKIRKPTIERARRILSWSPKVNLDEGLKLMHGEFMNDAAS